jgi:hypothetical protein
VKLLASSSPQRSSKLLLTENENVSLLLKGAEIVKTASSVGGVNSNDCGNTFAGLKKNLLTRQIYFAIISLKILWR